MREPGQSDDRLPPAIGAPPLQSPAAARFDAAALKAKSRAEDRYLRMVQLRGMDTGQLRVLLSGDPVKAAPWIECAAEYGLAEAQVRLAQMYLDGVGVAPEAGLALKWFVQAAHKGAPEAMNMAGRCYENGWGASLDLCAAADWFKRSAEAGYDWGEYNFANMLFDGRGVGRDQVCACSFYHRAADQGHSRAMNLLARCYEEGWGVSRDLACGYAWYQRSAEAGYFRGQFNFASLLLTQGRVSEALIWFERALEPSTSNNLSEMLKRLIGHGDERVAKLGRRLSDEANLAPERPAVSRG